jgi:hypothetical protein
MNIIGKGQERFHKEVDELSDSLARFHIRQGSQSSTMTVMAMDQASEEEITEGISDDTKDQIQLEASHVDEWRDRYRLRFTVAEGFHSFERPRQSANGRD